MPLPPDSASRALLRVFLASSLAISAPLTAQTAAPSPSTPATAPASDRDPIVLTPVTVTGSNIRRVDAEAALPVTVFDAAELDVRGFSTMAELFESVTLAEPSIVTEENYLHTGARGDAASINLRGLGVGSTLTLLNGRRMAPFPISTMESSVPALAGSINYIPSTIISRVEILRDGASAIYGADAAAGVINNLVSRTYEGRNLAARATVTQHGGGNETRFNYSEGFRRNKTHISTSLEFYHRDALTAKDRDWARNADQRVGRNLPAPWNGLPLVDTNGVTVRDNDFDNRQSVTPYGVWQRGTLAPDGTFIGARPTGNAGITTATAPSRVATMSTAGQFNFWQTATGEVVWKQTTPLRDLDSPESIAYANVNDWRVFQPKNTRAQLAVFLDRPLNDRVDLFGDLMLYRSRSIGGYEPINFNTADTVDGEVPIDNPWNPFGSRFYHPTGAPNSDGTPRLTGQPAALRIPSAVRLPELKPRVFKVDSYAYRALTGLRGKLAADWEWESALLYSGAQTHEYDYNTMRESWFRQALVRTDRTAFNPFGYTFKIVNNQIQVDAPYANPTALLDSLYWTAQRFARTNLVVWDAKANGRLWRLFNGGRIGAATGAEVRYETYKDGRPGYDGVNPPGSESQTFLRADDNDVINSSANVPISADQMIYAFYSELAFPFVTRENRKPLVHNLELTLAGRFEYFSIHGQSVKPKASLMWEPTRWLKLRGSYNESFRAPNLAQTSTTPIRRQASSTDYYRHEVTGLSDDAAHPRLTLFSGNHDLQPEKAQSWVAGFVVDVPKVRGLSFTLDYWRINQNDAFANKGAAATMLLDELYLDLATQAELAKGTPIDRIDLGSGTSSYRGYKVERLPVTDTDRALFAAYNARQSSNATRRAPVGQFVSVATQYINLGGRDIEGYELGLQYRFPRSRLGQFTARAESTHYIRREEQTEDGGPVLSTLGKDAEVKWRANASLVWRRDAWSAGWFTNYIGAFADTSAATTEAVYRALNAPEHIRVFNDNGVIRYLYRVEPFILHNANVSYRFGAKTDTRLLRGVTLRFGLNNVFDTEPPIVDEANAYSGGANVRGRQFTLDVSKAF